MTHTPNSSRPSRISRRRGFHLLGVGLVLLGFCVFAWGLRYKLSLYDPPHSVTRHMPEAKLVAGKERTAVPAVNLRQAQDHTLPVALSGLALLFLILRMPRFQPGSAGFRDLVPLPPAAASAFSPPLAVRPPPFVR
ncbi:MAG TPA: hypothetical protein VJS11_00010 [Acidobacteriaceae bacterium]|nr:hypothetical protein [Acidobacteriaceae bacterium]